MEMQHIVIVAKSLDYDHYASILDTLSLFQNNGCRLSLLQVVPEIPSYYYQIPSAVSIQEELTKEAWQRLGKIGRILSIDDVDQWVEVGALRQTVERFVKEHNVDFACVVDDKENRALPHGYQLTIEKTCQPKRVKSRVARAA